MNKSTKVHTPTTVVIKGKLPGEAVDRHLKTYGHLPNTKLCDEKGSCMPKLNKAKELMEDRIEKGKAKHANDKVPHGYTALDELEEEIKAIK